MKKIVLHSGWQLCNIGDIGHTPGTLRYLTELVPEAHVSVLIHRSNERILHMLGRRFPDVELLPRDPSATEGPGWEAAFESCDLVVQNSGMHYNNIYGYDPVLLRKCVAASKPFGLYGHSFDGFGSEQFGEMKRMLDQAEFIYCRDSSSLAYMRDCGIYPKVLEWGPDGCFGIDVRDDATALAYLESVGLEEGGFLTVTIRTNTPALEGGAGSRLNPRVVTAEHEEENERWASRLREVICGWVENTGKMVLLAPEVDKEIASARRYLLEKLPQQVLEQVVLRDRFWNVDEAASVYARAAALVSMEPHSCIIGLANGVPSIHYYSPKHGQKAGMFADVGLPEWLHDIEAVSADTVVEALKRIDSDRAGALSRVAEAMAVVNGRSAEMMGAIDKCLHAGSCGYVG